MYFINSILVSVSLPLFLFLSSTRPFHATVFNQIPNFSVLLYAIHCIAVMLVLQAAGHICLELSNVKCDWKKEGWYYSEYELQRILIHKLQGFRAPTICHLLEEEALRASQVGIVKFLESSRKLAALLESQGRASPQG